MSAKSQNELDNQQIDLSQISKAIGNFFGNISASLFSGILFIKRNIFILTALFVIGAAGGYFLDVNTKVYDHQIVVSPNFGSTDYLYSKIELLESRLKERDTAFFKSIGVKNPKRLIAIEVDPVIDIYNFVNNNTVIATSAQNTQNFELVKLLSEDGDINKVIEDKLTSKNYSHHTIHIITNDLISNKSTIDPILAYLNKTEYFERIKKTYLDNIGVKMKQNEGMIEQINNVLNQFSSVNNSNQKSDKLVYYNDNTQLNEIIQTKNSLIEEIGNQRMNLVNSNEIIKTNISVINLKNTKGLNNKKKLVLPVLLIFCFFAFTISVSFYRKQKAKLSN